MTLSPSEEMLINEMHFYSVHIRQYARSRILHQDESMRHILNQLSMDLVIGEVRDEFHGGDYNRRKNRIFRSLVYAGEVSDAAEKQISLTLDTLRDFLKWKRENDPANKQHLPEVAE